MNKVVPMEAAVVIAVAPDGSVLMTERRRDLSFLGGFVGFPGGRVEPSDGQGEARLQAAALRELEEETGLRLDPRQVVLQNAGHWITPASAPVRYDTWFYYVALPAALPPTPPVDGEHAWVEWRRPEQVLEDYRELRLVLSPPVKIALEVLAERPKDPAGVLSRVPGARTEEHLDFEPIAGVRVLPLLTPTLPPATHTNCYLIGDERLLIVDPATWDPDEREKLLGYLEPLIEAGARPEAVFLTHHHGDHYGAADWLSGQLAIPIWAHAKTEALLAGQLSVARTIEDGELLDLGRDRRGEPFLLQALHTPGHAEGHLVLLDRRRGGSAMIVGDMVASIGTIIIDPPEGDMAEYLRQLERLRAMPEGVLFPAHGPPIVGGHDKFDHYLSHRRAREAKVLAALQHLGPAEAEALLPEAYDDTPPALYPLAARSCLAHLLKLRAEGRAQQKGDLFLAVPSG